MKNYIIVFVLLSVNLLAQTTYKEAGYSKEKLISELKTEKNDSVKLLLLEYYGVLLSGEDPDSAISVLKQAGWLAIEQKQYLRAAGDYNNIGIMYYFRSSYDTAIDYYNQAIKMYQNNGSEENTGELHRSIGLCKFEKGEYTSSIEDYFVALELFQNKGDQRGIARTINSIGSSLEKIGEFDSALENYEKALEIKNELADTAGIAVQYMNIGNIYAEKGEIDTAIYFHQEALKMAKFTNDPNYIATAHITLANSYMKGEYWSFAEDVLLIAIAGIDRLRGDYERIQLYNCLGEVYVHYEYYVKALPYVENAVMIAENIGANEELRIAWKWYYLTMEGLGKLEEAYKGLKNYQTLTEELYSKEKFVAAKELQIKYEVENLVKENEKLEEENASIKKQEVNTGGLNILFYVVIAGLIGIIILLVFRIRKLK